MFKKRGFTVIELLIIAVVIGILVAVIYPNFTASRKIGRDARRVTDIRTIQTALTLYYGDFKSYPLTVAGLVPRYMQAEPKDPQSGNSYFYTAITRTSYGSTNCTAVPAVKYHLGAAMENSDATNMFDLKNDLDWPGVGNSSGYSVCSGTGADFHGNANTLATQPCVGVMCGVGGVACNFDWCYDITN